jgi:hypothetical protein
MTLWEGGLVQKMQDTTGNFWWSGWSHVNTILDLYNQEKRKYDERGFKESLNTWALESAQLACTISKQEISSPNVEAAWLRTVRDRILIAGARSSLVIGDVLSSRPVSAFRAPTENSRSAKPAAATATAGVWKNIVVVVLVVVVFAVVARRLEQSTGGGGRGMMPDSLAGATELTVNKLKE